ncbi:MAG: DUF3747 domain-containing protein [Synechococcales cyanobacterium T60_A2020_003]|nr:DUF3747 domain-containing protein [Synechococcales cyanobacterium T60_A2020_003]
MQIQHSLQWLSATLLGAGSILGLAHVPPATAQGFDQAEITDPSRIILVASPAGQVGHQLLIVEQLNDERPCWSESGGIVQPLLLDFDFSGICRRILDSNGYSLRMGNEDLGLDYALRVIPEGDHLALVASSTKDFFAPSMEVGRTSPGETSGFVAIYLAPGWRLTRRSFEGQTLGHYYITNDMDVDTYSSTAVLSGDVLLAPSGYTFPSTPNLPATPTVTPNDSSSIIPPTPTPAVVPTITAPSVSAPAPATPVQSESPLPILEAAPVVVPPSEPAPQTTLSPLLVPSPPPMSTDRVPEENASTSNEASPWIEFERQPSEVQTF